MAIVDFVYVMLIGFVTCFFGIPVAVLAGFEALSHSALYGLAIALGAMLVQGVYAAIAVASVGAYNHVSGAMGMAEGFPWDNLIVGGIIIFIAYKIYGAPPEEVQTDNKRGGLYKNVLLGVSLAVVAPQRIMLYILFISGFEIPLGIDNWMLMLLVVLGILLGTALWWAVYMLILGSLRQRLSARHIMLMQKVGALLMLAMAIFSLVPVAQYLNVHVQSLMVQFQHYGA